MNLQSMYSNVYDKLWMFEKYKKAKAKYSKNPKRLELQKKFPLSDEQKKQIDDYYLTYFGSKIPYDCHQNFAIHTGVFRYDYFADYLWRPYFEHFMNTSTNYIYAFEDKGCLPFVAHAAHVQMPHQIIINQYGCFRDSDNKSIKKQDVKEILGNIGSVIIKPTISAGSAKGIFFADFENGIDKLTGKEVLDVLGSTSKNYVVQKIIKCHEDLANLYSGCVNTFRIITYRWKDSFYAMPGVLRVGSGGGKVDNAHAGGMFMAIDDNGVIKGNGMTEFMNVYEKHPDSGIMFDGYKVNDYPKVLETAIRMHSMIPMIGTVNWDLTIDEQGEPVVIEANFLQGGFWIIQCAHACAPFGDRQPEVLQWIKKMKNLPQDKRGDFAFGFGV